MARSAHEPSPPSEAARGCRGACDGCCVSQVREVPAISDARTPRTFSTSCTRAGCPSAVPASQACRPSGGGAANSGRTRA
eukprot:2937740-Lingulodinium_polyedra.AAC.1